MHDLFVLFLHPLPLPLFTLAEHCKLCSLLSGFGIGVIAVRTLIEWALTGCLLELNGQVGLCCVVVEFTPLYT